MFWPRTVLPEDKAKTVCDALQTCLVHAIDTALTCKQAHWNLYGTGFLAVHERLDPIVENARDAADEIAERINQLGGVPDGRVKTVASDTKFAAYPDGYVEDVDAVKAVSDQLVALSQVLREAIEVTGDLDPLTEDILIAKGQLFEKDLWMLQAFVKKA